MPDPVDQAGDEQPKTTLPAVPTISQMMLLRRISMNSGLKHLLVVLERIAVGLHGEARR